MQQFENKGGAMFCNFSCQNVHRHDASLVTEVCIVLVESAQVAVVRRRGAEEDGRRQVVAAVFEELVHLSGNAWLNGHPVS